MIAPISPPTSTLPAAAGGPVVAIDGPAGSGKSTVATLVADALGVPHIDTGALYRAVTLAVLRAKADIGDPAVCGQIAERVKVERLEGTTYLNGEDVEFEIRGPEVTTAVSRVSAHGPVRDALVPAQRAAVIRRGGVVEGRDIGTIVLPDADLKVFLTADLEERARRRAEQQGPKVRVDDVITDLMRRDREDSERDVAPLTQAVDAWELDTTGLPIDEVVDVIADRASDAWAERVADSAQARGDTTRGQLPKVVIVGRPNVGKSTMLNRILRARVAIVEEKPGVTRDRTEHLAEWDTYPFLMVDTGGWESTASGMALAIVEQAEAALADATVAIFVVDGTVGALEDDQRYAKLLRRAGIPVILVANKVDSDKRTDIVHDLHHLGLGQARPVSAKHGLGMDDLMDVVVTHFPEDTPNTPPDETTTPRVAIVGKPNVGKSSLFNRLLGEERSIVSPEAHTTRDSVDTAVVIDGEPWVFVDTAGLRKHYRRGEDTELFSVDRTRAAIEKSDLVLFVLDASEPLGHQDQRLASMIRDAGCGVILVMNKWDLVDEERRIDLERELDRMLAFAHWAPRVNISALTGRGTARILDHLRDVWGNFQLRVPTGALNAWFRDVSARTPVPPVGSKTIRIKYVTQAETRPPMFIAFANGPVKPAYLRYLERELRASHDLTGVPVFVLDRRPEPREHRRHRR